MDKEAIIAVDRVNNGEVIIHPTDGSYFVITLDMLIHMGVPRVIPAWKTA